MVFAAWQTGQELAWGVHWGCHSYLLQQVLAPHVTSLQVQILCRFLGFFHFLLASPSSEVAVVARPAGCHRHAEQRMRQPGVHSAGDGSRPLGRQPQPPVGGPPVGRQGEGADGVGVEGALPVKAARQVAPGPLLRRRGGKKETPGAHK